MPLIALLAFFGLHAQGGGWPEQQPLETNRFASFLTPAILATGNAFQGLVDLVQQFFLPLQQPQLPLTMLLRRADIGGITGRLEVADRFEFFSDALLKLIALGKQQLTEEPLLGSV